MTRNRTAEPAERTRAQRRADGECELGCGQPTKGGATRCIECIRRLEGNTDRYRGQGRRGAPERSKTDIVDLGYAREAIEKAHRGFAEVATAGESNRRRKAELLIEPRSQAELARRLLDEVLARNPAPADNAQPLPPVDDAAPRGYHERKAEGLCVRCGRPAKDDADLCERHHRDALKRKRKAAAKRRAKRRAARRCVDCNRRTPRYRCEKCSRAGVDKRVDNAMSTTAERMRKMGL